MFPYPATSRDKAAPDIKIANLMDKDALSQTPTLRDERVVIKDTKTGKVYGVKTMTGISTKRSKRVTEAKDDIDANDIETALTQDTLTEIKRNIRQGAQDLAQEWKNALELTQKAYDVAGALRPGPDEKIAWSQYEDCIKYAVQQLARARGLSGSWRMTELGLKSV